MPRKSRIDAPGALHHIICRGLDRQTIFKDDCDRDNFIERLSAIVKDTDTLCFAWALIPNHFHLLLKTGSTPIATVMRRLLTGYAVSHNRRHGRSGHLFQNRYKGLHQKSDERILGESDLVESVLKQQDEALERRYGYRASGYDLDRVIERVSDLFDMPPDHILQAGKQPKRVQSRSLVCHWAVSELGLNGTAVGHRLGLTQSAVSRTAQRGRKIATESKFSLKI